MKLIGSNFLGPAACFAKSEPDLEFSGLGLFGLSKRAGLDLIPDGRGFFLRVIGLSNQMDSQILLLIISLIFIKSIHLKQFSMNVFIINSCNIFALDVLYICVLKAMKIFIYTRQVYSLSHVLTKSTVITINYFFIGCN